MGLGAQLFPQPGRPKAIGPLQPWRCWVPGIQATITLYAADPNLLWLWWGAEEIRPA